MGGATGTPAACGDCLDREGNLNSKGNVSLITKMSISRLYVKESIFNLFKEYSGEYDITCYYFCQGK